MTTNNEAKVTIENYDYDLNSLFNFQASFEQLKFVISALAKGQKKVLDRISNIEKNSNFTNIDGNGNTTGNSTNNNVIKENNELNDKNISKNNVNENNLNNDDVDGSKSVNNFAGLNGEMSIDLIMVKKFLLTLMKFKKKFYLCYLYLFSY